MAALTISYQEVFSSFLGEVTDHKLASLTESVANELMVEWLHKAFANIYINRLFSNLEWDDEVQRITFTMSRAVSDNMDKHFVVTVLGKQMAYEWVHPQVMSIENTAQVFGTKETKFYSQSAHTAELRALQEDSMLEVKRLIRDRGFVHNDYLEG